MQFAELLYSKGLYQSAIKEYKRLLFDKDNDSSIISIRIGDAFRAIDEVTKAQLWYEKVIDGGESPCRKKAHFKLVELDLISEKPLLARYELEQMMSYEINASDSAYMEFMNALIYVYNFESDSADYYLKLISTQSPYKTIAGRIIKRLGFYKRSSLKNPYLAMGMSSLVPGSGQIYTGRIFEGFGSFFLNSCLGLFLSYSALTANKARIDHDPRNLGIASMDFALVFSMIFMRYYNGGRKNAFHSAMEYNINVQKQYLRDISEIAGFKELKR
ncbi:MAG: hypothetical protein ABIA63_15665 [bacterium]